MLLSKLFSLVRWSEPSPESVATFIPTVTFDGSRVTAPVKADVLSTLKGYADIPRDKLPAINKAAVTAVERGGDLGMLCNAIMSSGIEGIPFVAMTGCVGRNAKASSQRCSLRRIVSSNVPSREQSSSSTDP